MSEIIPSENIINRIYFIRNTKVMLDEDLSNLYNIETRVLNQAVKRNLERFPGDFMFKLTKKEYNSLRSQIVILDGGRGRYRKYLPYVFTQYGILMLSSVLNSERAVQVNIQIMRTFTKLHRMLSTHEGLKRKIEDMEKRYDAQFKVVFDALKELLIEEERPKKRIGFKPM